MENKSIQILNEIKKVIVGKDEVITKTLMAILAGGHVLLEDVPGVGKTTLALAFSRAMNLSEKRVQFTPDTMASDIIGFSVYNKATGKFDFQPGAVFSNILLADEINRTSAKTQAALLEVMEEMHATVDGVTYQLPDPFVCMATQNPLGSAGTHPLPDSQLDRFMVRLSMGYPTIENTIEIVQLRQGDDPLDHVRPVATAEDIRYMRSAVTAVRPHQTPRKCGAGRQPTRRPGPRPDGQGVRLHERPQLCGPRGHPEPVHRRLRPPSHPDAPGEDPQTVPRTDPARGPQNRQGAGSLDPSKLTLRRPPFKL